jgi:hypothetical protein
MKSIEQVITFLNESITRACTLKQEYSAAYQITNHPKDLEAVNTWRAHESAFRWILDYINDIE